MLRFAMRNLISFIISPELQLANETINKLTTQSYDSRGDFFAVPCTLYFGPRLNSSGQDGCLWSLAGSIFFLEVQCNIAGKFSCKEKHRLQLSSFYQKKQIKKINFKHIKSSPQSTSEYTDQPMHMRNLIRVITERVKP